MNNPEKKSKIPDVPALVAPAGNLLSSVAPPSQLPNFITSPAVPLVAPAQPPAISQTTTAAPQMLPVQPHINLAPQETEEFSPAIPLSRGEPIVGIRSPDSSQATTQSPVSLADSTPETERHELGDIMPGAGLLTWVKGAVASGGILHRVAEKAKSSVDSMITTLDPQMKEYLNSGGDLYLVVASDKEVKVSPVREAFQAVFGKATVHGFPSHSSVTAVQPVGYASAYAAAKQRIADLRSTHSQLHNNVPVLAVEGFLQETIADRWYEVSLLVFSQPSLGIELQLQSQGTPVPHAAVSAMQASTAQDSAHLATGYDVTVGSIMAASLQVPHTQWQEATTGVSRRELLLLAAKSLAGSYKRLLAVSAAES